MPDTSNGQAATTSQFLTPDVESDVAIMLHVTQLRLAFVRSVEDDSPAQEAGICKGDIIVKFDGQKVSDGDDLLDKLQYYKSGEKIEAVIARATNGEYEENTIELTLGTRPDNE